MGGDRLVFPRELFIYFRERRTRRPPASHHRINPVLTYSDNLVWFIIEIGRTALPPARCEVHHFIVEIHSGASASLITPIVYLFFLFCLSPFPFPDHFRLVHSKTGKALHCGLLRFRPISIYYLPFLFRT